MTERLSGLAREFDASANEWREIAKLAALKPDLRVKELADVRAECWTIAADMAEKWHLARGSS